MRPIKHIRVNVFGVNQVTFAQIAGSTQGSVSKWEQGINAPDHREMERIRKEAQARNLPWDDRLFFEVPSGVAA